MPCVRSARIDQRFGRLFALDVHHGVPQLQRTPPALAHSSRPVSIADHDHRPRGLPSKRKVCISAGSIEIAAQPTTLIVSLVRDQEQQRNRGSCTWLRIVSMRLLPRRSGTAARLHLDAHEAWCIATQRAIDRRPGRLARKRRCLDEAPVVHSCRRWILPSRFTPISSP